MKKDRARSHTQLSAQCTIEATIGNYADMWRASYHVEADASRRRTESAPQWNDGRLHHYAPTPVRSVTAKRKWRVWR